MKKFKIIASIILGILTVATSLPAAVAVPFSVKYTGLKPLPAAGNTSKKNNKAYLKNENLSLVLQYINRHYFHGKYPEVRLNNGEILFPYGITTPTIFLRVRRITLIKFPAKTEISTVDVGNSADFTFKKITNATGDYLALKSTHPALRTTMIVNTADKLYYFNLVSTRHRYIPIAGFYFPGIYVKTYKTIAFNSQQNYASNKGFSLHDLNFQYYITGKGYKVVRVFNDGQETFIKLVQLGDTPLPAIFTVNEGKNYLVNFIYRGGYYIIRGVPKTIVLISRTKDSKKEVEIHYGKKPSPWTW